MYELSLHIKGSNGSGGERKRSVTSLGEPLIAVQFKLNLSQNLSRLQTQKKPECLLMYPLANMYHSKNREMPDRPSLGCQNGYFSPVCVKDWTEGTNKGIYDKKMSVFLCVRGSELKKSENKDRREKMLKQSQKCMQYRGLITNDPHHHLASRLCLNLIYPNYIYTWQQKALCSNDSFLHKIDSHPHPFVIFMFCA
ncbi:hypothetical protein EXN66_Car021269 [Channa argus]|uniref:Uncharacterized protein n=1 Tax=Channa argus TaxID=215402 RepID=A0A6G1QTN5_CHAAH|nr:hypothetical protein EXN66_Car021269 [Channa argus]